MHELALLLVVVVGFPNILDNASLWRLSHQNSFLRRGDERERELTSIITTFIT
jgi:hypothetical protein